MAKQEEALRIIQIEIQGLDLVITKHENTIAELRIARRKLVAKRLRLQKALAPGIF